MSSDTQPNFPNNLSNLCNYCSDDQTMTKCTNKAVLTTKRQFKAVLQLNVIPELHPEVCELPLTLRC